MAGTFDVPIYSMKWHFDGRVDGEAIPVDIGHNQTLYMVLGGREISGGSKDNVTSARFSSGFMNVMPKYRLWTDGSSAPAQFGTSHAGALKEIAWIKGQKGRVVSLDCNPRLHWSPSGECPAFVLTSRSGSRIEMLDPNDFAATLWPGYRLDHVTLQVTSDPVSWGIEQRLPWVRSMHDANTISGEGELKQMGFSRYDSAHF